MKKLLCLLCLTLAFSLNACALDDDDKDKKEKEDKKEKVVKPKETLPICPQVAIVRDLEVIRDYGNEKPAPDQLVAQALMKSVDGQCEYQDNGVDIKFDLSFVAGKGPRLGGLHTSFPYFIAIVDPAGKIVRKERMTEEIGFSSDSKLTDRAESLHVFLPLPKEQRQQGPNYQVLTGFQLTKEQLEDSKTIE